MKKFWIIYYGQIYIVGLYVAIKTKKKNKL